MQLDSYLVKALKCNGSWVTVLPLIPHSLPVACTAVLIKFQSWAGRYVYVRLYLRANVIFFFLADSENSVVRGYVLSLAISK